MEDFQQRIPEDPDPVQTRLRGNDPCLSDTIPRRSQILGGKRPEPNRAGMSLSDGQEPYASIWTVSAGRTDSIDETTPGGGFDSANSVLPLVYGPEARLAVSDYAHSS